MDKKSKETELLCNSELEKTLRDFNLKKRLSINEQMMNYLRSSKYLSIKSFVLYKINSL